MKIHKVRSDKAGIYSALVQDYINGKAELSAFYQFPPNPKGLGEALEAKADVFKNREALREALIAQYEAAGERLPDNVMLLHQENAFTVTTGHQLCLFTGPLYFIYKVVTTINLADALNKQHPNYRFVPVFWMATEDHDLDEVNHVNLFNHTATWEGEERGAVGRMPLTGIDGFIAEVERILLQNDALPQAFDELKECYLTKNLAKATRKLVHILFPDSGLVVVDGDDVALKHLFIPQFKADLEGTVKPVVDATNEDLKELGYKSRVNARNTNLFYLRENNRTRIEKTEEGYVLADQSRSWRPGEIQTELEAFPDRFSPNVVLRPVYQEAVLPNLAYVGGPGEISYWLQLKGVFDLLEVPYPVLILRNSVLWLTEGQTQQMLKWELEPDAWFGNEDDVISALVTARSSEYSTLLCDLQAVRERSDKLMQMQFANPQARMEAEIEVARELKRLKKNRKILLREEKKRFSEEIDQVLGLKRMLFPNGVPQERYDNVLMYLKHHPDFIAQLRTMLNPFVRDLYMVSN